MEVNLYNLKGDKLSNIELPSAVFEARINIPLMHEVVEWYMRNKRQGTHAAKTRAEVSGSGRKPWKQKGTGRARAGSIRSPLWRHGGVIFAKKPRDFSFAMPKKKVRGALLSALSSKAKDGNIIVVEDLKVKLPKTKEMANIMKNIGRIFEPAAASAIVIAKRDADVSRASRNMKNLKVTDIDGLNTYDVLKYDKIVFTKEAVERIGSIAEI
ncbi:MAG: 50S ribosomal protein L4 [Elusimicrobia bacterium ADurb.Bin231]|nr:MAG: 50S ribosomal protein L4 [Elusimicrobia bacterium ADurb.Bin231]